MKCYNCGNEFMGDECPKCGVRSDISLKIYNLSARLYNRALYYTQDGFYTEAVHSLRKSLAFRKDNIEAQNLLGLVYHRIGRITDAIVCWQKSMQIASEDNPARDYLQDLEQSVVETSKFESIHNYNEALAYMQKGNVDLAIMSLKRAVEVNKYFVDAHNLMALCYIKNGNSNEALKCVNRVLRMDKANEIATNYLRELRPDKFAVFEQKEPKNNGYGKTTERVITAVQSYSGNIMYFVAGVVISIIVAATLVIPSVTKNLNEQMEKKELEYHIQTNADSEKIAQNEQTIQKLSEENENLKSKLYTKGEQELQQRVKALADIKNLYDEGSVAAAGDKLAELGTTGFSQDVMNEYNSLKTTVLPAAAKEYYDRGTNAADNRNNSDAKNYFERCIKCGGETEIAYSAMYQLAQLADKRGDTAEAVKYYTTVAQKHPVDAIKKEAQSYIDSH